MISLILGLAPYLLKFVGGPALETWVERKRMELEAGTAKDEQKTKREIAAGEREIERRALQRDLQLKEMEVWWIYFPKALLMWVTSIYLSSVIVLSLLRAGDRWGLYIDDVPPRFWDVMMLVVAYWFLDKAAKTWGRKP